MQPGYIRIAAPDLERCVGEIFAASSCASHEALRIARYLVRANLAGHDSHGVVRVARYLGLQRDGKLHPNKQPEVVLDTPALAVVDAHFGYGQTAAPFAVECGIAKCRASGLSAVALRNSGHVGRAADWAEMAAEAGLVSIHFVNAAGSVLVAPFGSTERRFSTAPFAVGVPLPGRSPILLDFATSVVAEGKVFVASQGGKPVPADSLIGPDGVKSGDPHVLYGDYGNDGKRDIRGGKGALRAFGEHKGSGLALACEVLAGALTGNGCASDKRPFANGMLSIYIDPAKIDPEQFFPEEAAAYVAHVKAARTIEPGGETLIPGEPEERTRAQRLEEGIPLPEETWGSVVQSGIAAGLDADWAARTRALVRTHA